MVPMETATPPVVSVLRGHLLQPLYLNMVVNDLPKHIGK